VTPPLVVMLKYEEYLLTQERENKVYEKREKKR